MKIIYCGFGRAGLECYYQLMANFEVSNDDVMVFTHDSDENREFIHHLKINRIKYFFDSVNNHYDKLLEFQPDYLLSVYYRYIIKSEILSLTSYKAMNLHPSLLPAYRGTKSSVWALLNNEKATGASFHYINEKIDDGNIILQIKINILPTDTAFSLYNKLISIFVMHFKDAFFKVINHDEGTKQKGKVSYYKRELPFNGIKIFDEISYQEGMQFVKAMYFPPFKGAVFITKEMKEIEINTIEDLDQYKDKFRTIK